MKSQITFGIKSDSVKLDEISKDLNILPSASSFEKGDSWQSSRDGTTYIRNSTIWKLESQFTDFEEESVSHHIDYFKSLFSSRLAIARHFKEDSRFEVTFWIWIETDDAGIGLDLHEEELEFLNSISNRIHFSLICNMMTEG